MVCKQSKGRSSCVATSGETAFISRAAVELGLAQRTWESAKWTCPGAHETPFILFPEAWLSRPGVFLPPPPKGCKAGCNQLIQADQDGSGQGLETHVAWRKTCEGSRVGAVQQTNHPFPPTKYPVKYREWYSSGSLFGSTRAIYPTTSTCQVAVASHKVGVLPSRLKRKL
jgi:hypothetical protein